MKADYRTWKRRKAKSDLPNICVIGARDVGKSTYVEESIIIPCLKKNLDILVYDPNGEYGELGMYTETYEEFLEHVYSNVRNSVVIWEESSSFLRDKGRSEKLERILQRNMHDSVKLLNVLVFHDLQAMPLFLRAHINYVVLFHTTDSELSVRQKFKDIPEIYEAYKSMRGEFVQGKFVEIHFGGKKIQK